MTRLKLKQLTMAAVALAVLALLPAAAHADPLQFTLNNPNQSGAAGSTLMFLATVFNSGTSSPTAVTINGSTFSFGAPPAVELDDTAFFTNFDGQVVAAGQSRGPLAIFNVVIGAAAAPGTYTGQFTIFYDGVSLQQSAAQDFSVTVAGGEPIPEPATMVLLGTGLAGAVAARRRKRRQQDVARP